ncbi:MAG: hypothetical protein WA869_09655 [Alloacidobacterium sp.]
MKKLLSATYGESAVPPELHAPDQRLGLPQDVPIFPNLAQRAAARVPAAPPLKRRTELDEKPSALQKDFPGRADTTPRLRSFWQSG